jgi:hypothetical protein
MTEANARELFDSIFLDITAAPFNVVFDPVYLTEEIIGQNTAGLRAAFQTPGLVPLPAGYCTYDGDVEVGPRTYAAGRGGAATVLQIRAGASWDTRGIIFPAGTSEAGLKDLTVDGNQPNRILTGGSGGIYGTNISVVNSTQIRISGVRSVNAVQHCFDITTPYYGNAGDGAIIPNPSEYVWLENCFADRHGDDGFTTHGSGKIWFTNCHAKGSWKNDLADYFNCNGFEIDDYSYDVTITNCHAEGNAHGFEVKAHGNMSAATNVRLIGCTAERNEINFSLRHIGHHSHLSPAPSKTAKNVQLIGCTSKHPRRVFFGPGASGDVEDIPDDQTPAGDQYSGLVIGAFRGVTVTNFHHIGDPTYDYAGSAAILVHFLAEDVIIDGYHIEGHTTGNWDIYATGGEQPAKNVRISNGIHKDSAIGGISTGGASNASIRNVFMSRNVAGSPNGVAVRAYGAKTVVDVDIDPATPYATNFLISDVRYKQYETPALPNLTY